MKDYLAKPKPVSPYEELIGDYNGPITQAGWGEVGGIPTIMKQQMNPSARKIASRQFNQRRTS
tara:strand:- start:303 stop:491 length:189 start_codon:yes stop_codon:yes gene_type:complete